MIRPTPFGLFPSMHWKTALCSLSTGRMRTPCRRLSMTRDPAVTSVSLLARATSFPASMAARVGTRPAAPTIADSTRSAVFAVSTGSLHRRRGPSSGSRNRAFLRACRRGPRRSRRRSQAESARPELSDTDILPRRQGNDLQRAGVFRHHVEGVHPDRSRRAEYGDLLHASMYVL